MDTLPNFLSYPFGAKFLFRKKLALKLELLAKSGLIEKTIENNAACPLTKPETIDNYNWVADKITFIPNVVICRRISQLQYTICRQKHLISYPANYIAKLDEYDWVQTTIKITDALGSYTNRTVDREDYFLIQASAAYRFKELYDCFDPEHPNGHPAVQLPPQAEGFNAFHNGVCLQGYAS